MCSGDCRVGARVVVGISVQRGATFLLPCSITVRTSSESQTNLQASQLEQLNKYKRNRCTTGTGSSFKP